MMSITLVLQSEKGDWLDSRHSKMKGHGKKESRVSTRRSELREPGAAATKVNILREQQQGDNWKGRIASSKNCAALKKLYLQLFYLFGCALLTSTSSC